LDGLERAVQSVNLQLSSLRRSPHTSLEDPAQLVPLYATIGKLRLFASARTVAAADAVMERIVETYYLPNLDFTARPSPQVQVGDFDILRDFTEACRAELRW